MSDGHCTRRHLLHWLWFLLIITSARSSELKTVDSLITALPSIASNVTVIFPDTHYSVECALVLKADKSLISVLPDGPRGNISFVQQDGLLCITFEHVNAIIKDAISAVGDFVPKEVKELSSNSPKPAHIAVIAAIMEEATRTMVRTFSLTLKQIHFDLRGLDTTMTIAEDICPTFLQPVRCDVSKYRTMSGMCNNLRHPSWASARSAMVRFLPPAYQDGISQPRSLSVTGDKLPNPRLVSIMLHTDVNANDFGITIMLVTWGQVIVHDINFGSPTLDERGNPIHCCMKPANERHPSCFPIDVPKADHFSKHFNRTCMNFVRLTPSLRPHCPFGPREPMNIVSGYLDGSIMYGSKSDSIALLREPRGGLLRSLPIYKQLGLKNLLPQQTRKPDFLCQRHNRPKNLFCFEGGDLRSNQQLPLTLMHTFLMREHNRIATFLSKYIPTLDDETIFEETRRLTVAQLQQITYREFLPVVLGDNVMKDYGLHLLDLGYYDGYDPKINAEPRVAFQAAAFRFGHSLVPDSIERFNKFHQKLGSIRLSHILRQPFELYKPAIVDTFILGLVNQPASRMDPTLTSELTNHLFERPGNKFGSDLAAANLQRGRDMGVPAYNHFRAYCGLSKLNEFSDLIGLVSNRTLDRLESVYANVNDIDLWSAGVAEFPLPGALVGPVFACLIGEQFANIRKGDRFWFENNGWPSSFSSKQLNAIRKTSLARLLCDNSDDIRTIQVFPMLTADQNTNPRIECSKIPGINLSDFFEDQLLNDKIS